MVLGKVGLAVAWSLGCALHVPAQMGPMPMSHAAKTPAVPSTNLTLAAGGKVMTLSAAELAAMPRESVTVMNSHLKKSESYSGVPVAALLAKMGLPFEKANEPVLLRSYLVAKGTDGYVVVVSVYEALSDLHEGTAIVADKKEGQPLGQAGAFELILSNDKRPQRWVRNLTSISLETVR